MEIQEILKTLREKNNLTQGQLAERVMVTRQAVSRWENGETQPNTDTLKLLSHEFGVSINTLLGSPRKLICQCCGMPLEDDEIISRDADGTLNEDYCKWCYADGTYTYGNMDDLIDVCVGHMMIDERYQGKGYGKAAMQKCLSYISEKPFGYSDKASLTCHKENTTALALYRALGFVETGNCDEEEIELALHLNH